MSLTAFFASRARQVENVRVPASSRFLDKAGEPIEWEIRCLGTEEEEAIRRACAVRAPVPGKRGIFASETDHAKYLGRLAAACTVFPNLQDRELQDSYGVMGAEALIKAMLSPGEYADYVARIQELCGFGRSVADKTAEIKNS